jgi:hypothetical protein
MYTYKKAKNTRCNNRIWQSVRIVSLGRKPKAFTGRIPYGMRPYTDNIFYRAVIPTGYDVMNSEQLTIKG